MDEQSCFEFWVVGKPVSGQAAPHSRKRWGDTLRDAIHQRIETTVEQVFLVQVPTAATIFVLSSALPDVDLDNLAKPILDALTGTVLQDDGLIERLLVKRFDLGSGAIGLDGSASEYLSQGLEELITGKNDDTLVYVRWKPTAAGEHHDSPGAGQHLPVQQVLSG
jgi:hypothetical protein